MKLKVIDEKPRSVLGEGRSQGMGQAFAKRRGDEIILVDPPSPCSEYMNDRLYSEWTGKECSAHGLKTKKEGIFEDGYGYVVTKICGSGARSNSKYAGMEKDISALDNNANLGKMLNGFEAELKLPQCTDIFKAEDNLFVFRVPIFWCETAWGISLYAKICRNGVYWDGKGSPIDFLATGRADGAYTMPNVVAKLKRLLAGERPKWSWEGVTWPHGLGIVALVWP